MNKRRIAIIHANDGSDVRIGKFCRTLCGLGFDCHFIGWNRREGQAAADLANTTTHIMSYPTKHGRSSKSGTLRYWRHVVSTLRRVRPQVASAVNEETGFLLLPFRGVLFDKLVCDVFDALADRLSNKKWPVRATANLVSAACRSGAHSLIATDQNRWNRFGAHQHKTVIVENFPEDPGDDLARNIPSGPPQIYVGGTLSAFRGLDQILAAIKGHDSARILCAGWPYDDCAQRFISHPRVDYRGIVNQRESLQLTSQCDAVLAYYEPRSEQCQCESEQSLRRIECWTSINRQSGDYHCGLVDEEQVRLYGRIF